MKPRWEWVCLALALLAAPLFAASFSFSVQAARGIEQLTVGLGVPEIGFLMVGLLVLAGFAGAMWRLTVFRFPRGTILLVFIAFWLLLLASLTGTIFPATASRELVRWSVCLCPFLLAAGISGRGRYAVALGGVLAVAGALESVWALHGYAINFRTAPDWRTFGTFFNPDMLAGYLVMVIPLCLAFVGRIRGSFAPLGVLLCFLPLPALIVTGSRGGLLAAAVAIVAFGALVWWNRVADKRLIVRTAIVLGAAAALFILISSAGGTKRVTSGGTEVRHSTEFRRHLWQDTAVMIEQRPLTGHGIGAFVWAHGPQATIGFTRLAHETYLQLGAEAGVPALAMFVVLLGLWLFAVAPRGREVAQDEEFLGVTAPLLRSALIAGVIGALVHNAVDSDLYLMANGITFWTMLGLALAVSVDGVMPIFLPKPVLGIVGTAVALVLGVILFTPAVGASHAASAQADEIDGLIPSALEGYQSALAWQPDDRRYLVAAARMMLSTGRDSEAFALLQRAQRAEPSCDTFVAAGRLYLWAKEYEMAETALKNALSHDPHSPSAQRLLLQLYQGRGDKADEEQLARRVVDQRQSLYAQVRAVPEVVETLYADADMILASDDQSTALPHLRTAFADYAAFMRTTFPMTIARGQYSPVPEEMADTVRDSYFECAAMLLAAAARLEPLVWDQTVREMWDVSKVVSPAYESADKKASAVVFQTRTGEVIKRAVMRPGSAR